MKLILYFEELILLKSMEGRDQELTKRLAKCRQDKGGILRDINAISSKLRDKKVEIDKIKAREDELMAKFHELCAEGSEKYDIIRAYFEKVQKIRKGKRTTNQEKESEEMGRTMRSLKRKRSQKRKMRTKTKKTLSWDFLRKSIRSMRSTS